MDVLFDARLLHRSLSGLERYQRNMVRELALRPEIERLRVLVMEGTVLPDPWPANAETVEVHSTQEILGILLNDDPGQRPDVYHLSWFPDHHPQDLLLLLAANASVAEVHDAILNRHPEYHPNDETWEWYDRFIKALVRSCDRILLHSNSVRGELERELGGDPAISDLAPLAVDPVLRDPVPERELKECLQRLEVSGDYVVIVGKDYPHKDHATLFRALARTKSPVRVICAGSHVWTRAGNATKDLIEELGVGDRIRWIEGLDDEDLKALMTGSRAMVYPSVEEGFGLPPFEAMVLGVPVIAARSMSIPEVCQDAVWYFETGDADELASQLDRMLAGGAEVDALIARGREHEKTLSWRETVAATVKCYENALATAASGKRPRASLPDGVAACLSVMAKAPYDDKRDLQAWQKRCLAREMELAELRAEGGPGPVESHLEAPGVVQDFDQKTLVTRMLELQRTLEERERWIAALLDEVRGRRLKLFPRQLQDHEERFLGDVRDRQK